MKVLRVDVMKVESFVVKSSTQKMKELMGVRLDSSVRAGREAAFSI
ncbi:MAG: hypothetical protein ABSG57_12285 [Candidatus Bathyarchaeia archaeon]|jgi:hypothetical protein